MEVEGVGELRPLLGLDLDVGRTRHLAIALALAAGSRILPVEEAHKCM